MPAFSRQYLYRSTHYTIGQLIKMASILTWETSNCISCIFPSSSIDCWVRGGGWTWYRLSFTCNLWIRYAKNVAYSKSIFKITRYRLCDSADRARIVCWLLLKCNPTSYLSQHCTIETIKKQKWLRKTNNNLPEAIVQKAFNRTRCCDSNTLFIYDSRTIDSFIFG